jgi:hypothetical protein
LLEKVGTSHTATSRATATSHHIQAWQKILLLLDGHNT